jgi:protein-S-isoprenylcysteine O-methyltransferase Ste14
MTDRWRDVDSERDDGRQRGMLTVGVLLVLLGAFFLASEQLNFDFGRFGWPIFVIAPGVFLLLLGLAIPHEGGLGAAIPGGIVTTVGLLLAFQEATGTYASWSYAWALVAPGSVGATLALYGLLHRRWDLLDAGLRTGAVGLGLFIGFGLFFENIIGVDNVHPNTLLRNALPAMAVGLGILIVLFNLMPERSQSRSGADAWSPVEPPAPPTPSAG